MRPYFLFILYVVGEVFPVAEMSFLALIEEKLQDSKVLADWTQQTLSQVDRPQALKLPRALKTETHTYVPQVILKNDIVNHASKVIWKQGTSINALEQLPSYRPHWIFLNADDIAQQKWAKRQLQGNVKVILIGGSIRDTSTSFQQEIFFDQGGRISRQLGITHVPASVTRKKNTLLIREISIKENGDEA
jgi:conjugal transfer pilus assembly protein TraW